MGSYRYSTKINEHMAKALLVAEAISTKHSVEICNLVRGLSLQKAKKILEEVIAMKRAVPFKRYNDNVGHRKGMGPGRYPIKAASKILSLLNTVNANAQIKNLDSDALIISHICSHMASRPMRGGRKRGRISKKTHVEVVVIESPDLKKEKTSKKDLKKQAKESKPEVKESKPEAKESKPEVKESKPEAKESKPEVKESKPEVKESKPEVKESKPEAKESKPEVKESKPEAKESKPEAKESKPEAKESKVEAKENIKELKSKNKSNEKSKEAKND
jgi:large subunit ribosomal protein L22